jgi:hypothetical protein
MLVTEVKTLKAVIAFLISSGEERNLLGTSLLILKNVDF